MEVTWQSMTVDQFCKETIQSSLGHTAKLRDIHAKYKEWSKFNPSFKYLPIAELTDVMSKKYEYDAETKMFKNIIVIYEHEEFNMEVYRKLLPRCDKCNHLL